MEYNRGKTPASGVRGRTPDKTRSKTKNEDYSSVPNKRVGWNKCVGTK